jgi:hypothetical protein
MSYDSVRMLEEARSSVRGGIYPAAPVYMLRVFDVTGHGLTLMLQAQNFILLLSLMLILRMLGASLRASTFSLLAILAMPTVIGCMLVLWKDVTFTSLMLLSTTIIFWASQEKEKNIIYELAKWTALVLLLLATLVRFNGITSTAVIALYWVVVFYNDQRWKIRCCTFIAIIFCMGAANKIINNYRFPDFSKLDPNPLVSAIMAYDLVGISGWSRESLVPIDSFGSTPLSKADISDIDKIYSPLGILAMNENNVSHGGIVKIFSGRYSDKDVISAWLTGIYHHPVAYLRYRWDLFSEIIGATNHATFEPTHFNRIDDNPFGIKFSDRHLTKYVLAYIRKTSNLFLGKPWVLFLLSCISIPLIFRTPLIRSEYKIFSYYSFAATMLYILPFFSISGTGEVRYCFPALVFGSVPLLVWMFGKQPQQFNQ